MREYLGRVSFVRQVGQYWTALTMFIVPALYLTGENGAVLVFSRRGISRAAAICVGYVMYSTKSTLKVTNYHIGFKQWGQEMVEGCQFALVYTTRAAKKLNLGLAQV